MVITVLRQHTAVAKLNITQFETPREQSNERPRGNGTSVLFRCINEMAPNARAFGILTLEKAVLETLPCVTVWTSTSAGATHS